MTVTNIRSKTVKTYWVALEAGEVRDKPYSRAGTQYQVTTIVVTKQDGNVSSIELHGRTIKKDGSPSQNAARESFYRQSEWPEWVRGIVGGLS